MAVPSTPPVIVKHDVSPLPERNDKCNVQETSNTAHTLFAVGGWITVDGNGKAHKTDNGRTPGDGQAEVLQHCMTEGEHRERWDSVSGLIKAGRRAQTARVEGLCKVEVAVLGFRS